ncbi:MAG: magnesium/cobalt transporter CorA [Candidatus Methanomethylophilaceae archaeon]|nr:magnesium/cobalt transporter CorA [Candidatus Methanomethylophilaceae archaeon]
MIKSRVARFHRHFGRAAGNFEVLVTEEEKECRSSARLHAYDSESYRMDEGVGLESLDLALQTPGVKWLEVCGICDLDLMRGIQERFHIHPLLIEDIMNADVKPKVEDHEDFIFIIGKIPTSEGDNHRLDHFSMLLMPTLVVTFVSSQTSHFENIRQRLSAKDSRTRRRNADYLAHVILDTVVDHFILAAKMIEDSIDLLQEDEPLDPEATLKQIGALKKRTIGIRREAISMQKLSMDLKQMESDLVGETVQPYMNDLHDHTVFVMDTLDSCREVLMEMHQLQLALMSQRMNDIMRVLTIVATIFIPLTFVAGVYGMNFHNMPELGWDMGYFGILLFMAVVGVIMVYMFRRRGWL